MYLSVSVSRIRFSILASSTLVADVATLSTKSEGRKESSGRSAISVLGSCVRSCLAKQYYRRPRRARDGPREHGQPRSDATPRFNVGTDRQYHNSRCLHPRLGFASHERTGQPLSPLPILFNKRPSPTSTFLPRSSVSISRRRDIVREPRTNSILAKYGRFRTGRGSRSTPTSVSTVS